MKSFIILRRSSTNPCKSVAVSHIGRGSQKLFSFGQMTAHKSKTHMCKIRDGKE